jgi:putative membrane protein
MKRLCAFALPLIAGMTLLGAGNQADSHFATKAAAGGLAEVQLGQLAVKNASNADVKAFGPKMIDDHSKANTQLQQVASKDNITLPTSMDPKDQATYDRLSKLTGPAFDRAYMKDMVADHHKDIAEFQKEANEGKNPDLKNFASQTLPILQQHLQMAEHANSEVMTTSSNRGPGQ